MARKSSQSAGDRLSQAVSALYELEQSEQVLLQLLVNLVALCDRSTERICGTARLRVSTGS